MTSHANEPITNNALGDGEPVTQVSTRHTTSTVDNNPRSRGPFERRINRKLFLRPAHLRGPAPGWKDSFISALTYSWVNVLLVFNPIAWALYFSHQNSAAVFATSLLAVMPLAGLLGHGTESIALYTGDALGGLINASLGNATELIIAILLLVKCELRVVQASLLGGLLSNLLLVTGMAFLVGGIRFSEQEFQQTAAQMNTSLMTLAVIALIIPSIFAFALEQAVGTETERQVVLEMSRGSAVILIIIYVLSLIFQLYSHSHLYNPDAEIEFRTPSTSSSSSRSSSPSRVHVAEPSSSTAAAEPKQEKTDNDRQVKEKSARPSIQQATAPSSPGPGPLPSQDFVNQVSRRLIHPPPRRANSLPFGSAAALGRGTRFPPINNGRVNEKAEELRGRNGFFTPRPRDVEQGTGAIVEEATVHEVESPEMNLPVACITLLAATGLTYLTAEALTDSLEEIGNSGAVTKEWLGLVLLAVVGNAAEHVTAVFVAYRNKVDLALAVSIGSCIQIALFVIPLLVIIGWIAGKPLSLLFDPLEVVTLFLSVILVRFATEDGRTHYMSGVTLTFTYILIAYAFWYYPAGGTDSSKLFENCDIA